MKLAGGKKKRNRRKKKEKHRMLRSETAELERQVRAGLGQRAWKELKNNRQRERERERETDKIENYSEGIVLLWLQCVASRH